MSTFTNRINAIGEFSVGQGKFIVLEVKGGLLRVVQTHSVTNGSVLPGFAITTTNGIATTPTVQMPQGFIVPQNHSALDGVRDLIEDIDSRNLTLCSVCVGNGVTLSNMENACASCMANDAAISYLKTV